VPLLICLGRDKPKLDDWVIVSHTLDADMDDKTLWKCPFSSNSWIPPKSHWVAVDELADVLTSGIPKVKYISDFSRAP
jgi:hypothetical protein